MNDQENARQILNTLIEKTRQGRVAWRENVENYMSAKLPDGGRIRVTKDYDTNMTALYSLQVLDGDDQVTFECGTDPAVTRNMLTPLEDSFEKLFDAIREHLPRPSSSRIEAILESIAKL